MHLLIVAPLLLAQTAPAPAPAKRRLAVLDLRADVSIDEGTLRTLNELLLNAFDATGLYVALGMSDIASMLSHESQTQMLSTCSDDESCLAEIGGAFGVELIASSSLGAVGESYVITIKVINVDTVTVLARWSEVVPRDDSRLLEGVRAAVAHVAGGPPGAAAPTDSSEPSRFWPWMTAGVAGACVAGAGVFGLLASGSASSARQEADGSPAWQEHRDQASSYALTTDVLLGIGVATAITSLVLFLVEPDVVETATFMHSNQRTYGTLQWRF